MPVGALGPEEAPWAVGVGLPYGRITARALAHLTQAAARAGAGHARPSPSRALVFVLDGGKADVLLDAARECGLILDANDPRLKMDVCPGSPACLNGTTSTRGDADALAEVLREVPFSSSTVHVSGCAKGCARRGPADLTLVARNGFYDVIRDDGVNGAPLASRIASEDLPDAIRRLAGGAHA